MDKISKRVKKKTKTLQTITGYNELVPIKIESLLYADDTILMADSSSKITKITQIWAEEMQRLGMEINASKLKIMIIINRATWPDEKKIEINGIK